jgi:hypothetical protein
MQEALDDTHKPAARTRHTFYQATTALAKRLGGDTAAAKATASSTRERRPHAAASWASELAHVGDGELSGRANEAFNIEVGPKASDTEYWVRTRDGSTERWPTAAATAVLAAQREATGGDTAVRGVAVSVSAYPQVEAITAAFRKKQGGEKVPASVLMQLAEGAGTSTKRLKLPSVDNMTEAQAKKVAAALEATLDKLYGGGEPEAADVVVSPSKASERLKRRRDAAGVTPEVTPTKADGADGDLATQAKQQRARSVSLFKGLDGSETAQVCGGGLRTLALRLDEDGKLALGRFALEYANITLPTVVADDFDYMCDEIDAWLGNKLAAAAASPSDASVSAARRALGELMRKRKQGCDAGTASGEPSEGTHTAQRMSGHDMVAAMLDLGKKGEAVGKEAASEVEMAAEEQAMLHVTSNEATLRKVAAWREMAALQQYEKMRGEIASEQDDTLRKLATLSSALEGNAGAQVMAGPQSEVKAEGVVALRKGAVERAPRAHTEAHAANAYVPQKGKLSANGTPSLCVCRCDASIRAVSKVAHDHTSGPGTARRQRVRGQLPARDERARAANAPPAERAVGGRAVGDAHRLQGCGGERARLAARFPDVEALQQVQPRSAADDAHAGVSVRGGDEAPPRGHHCHAPWGCRSRTLHEPTAGGGAERDRRRRQLGDRGQDLLEPDRRTRV